MILRALVPPDDFGHASDAHNGEVTDPTINTTPWPTELEPYLTTLGTLDKNWNARMAAGDTRVQIPVAELATPAFTLDVEAVHHNISTMQAWVDGQGLLLAPHGKTTMTPGLWWWQLAAGSWAITVATEAQLRVARSVGIPRVIVANLLLSPQALAWLATEMAADPQFEVICWVDSVEAVTIMEAGLVASAATRPLSVCVERGARGGRTGARTHPEAVTVAEAVVASPHLSLVGVAGFEGSVTAGSDGAVGGTREGAVRAFLDGMAHTFVALAELYETDSPVLTAGGSTDFDLVAESFTPVRSSLPTARLVVRSGCYAIHDDGLYRDSTPAATRSGPHFVAAAHVWARVLSVPEPGRAVLDAGKRDLAYDSALPEVIQIYRADATGHKSHLSVVPVAGATITALNDQHAYLSFSQVESAAGAHCVEDGSVHGSTSIRVGDIVKLGISHPCMVFDKWRSVLLLDPSTNPSAGGTVCGVLSTYF